MQVLCDEKGFITSFAFIGNLVDGIEVDFPDDEDHFADNFAAYQLKGKKLVFDEKEHDNQKKKEKTDNIRKRRETECFTVINRGLLWYETLTVSQKIELTKWYRAWLDATNTGVIPEQPEWL